MQYSKGSQTVVLPAVERMPNGSLPFKVNTRVLSEARKQTVRQKTKPPGSISKVISIKTLIPLDSTFFSLSLSNKKGKKKKSILLF